MVSLEHHQSYAMLPRHMSDDSEGYGSHSTYPDPPQNAFSASALDISLASGSYYPRAAQDYPTSMATFDNMMSTADANVGYMPYGGRMSPIMFQEDREMEIPPSNLSSTSAPSAPSSAVGSPRSNHGQQALVSDWAGPQGMGGMSPGIVGSAHDYYSGAGTEYSSFGPQGMEDFAPFTLADTKPHGFVDPSLIHPEMNRPMMPYENSFPPQPSAYPNSPALTASSPHLRTGSASPYMPPNSNYHYSPYPAPVDQGRRPSMGSFHSGYSAEQTYSDGESKEKQRCPHPDCGKTYKDLKAHMLTHQTERPEKCPIQTCDYHVKGFARKYDKNRHTLTHYKGTMVCGFCPGSGSAAEKSFNRADVFKRHLTAVHGVEQTPPNSRKKAAANAAGNNGKKLVGYAPDATGKCSTCSQTFSNAQDFYEHLDDCVLRIVQQEDPAEAINARRLAEVENDRDVHATLEKANLPTTTQVMAEDDDEDEMGEDEDALGDEDWKALGIKASGSPKKKGPVNGVQKSRGMTHSRGGVALPTKNRGRKNRKDYPSSWGFDKGQMTMKKRVLTVFDGPRRLAKDDMMLSTEQEVRVPLSDGKYVTDLDIHSINRATGFLGATEEEKGIWVNDDPTEDDYNLMIDARLR